jgi:hypothetical protein
MIKEGVELKKHKYEMIKMLEDINNRMSDLLFLKIELSNELKILKGK